ncbi:MAG: AAA family ATPase [Treponemataceae bacterium]
MADLFENESKTQEPLAARMRPRNLDEFVGQQHIVGSGRLLRRAIAADQLTSIIFYGPPGTGKTTLARVIAAHTKSNFLTLNAVLTGVQNIREAISQATTQRKMYDRRTILFVDEVHRWNKSQQDALLPWVENGTIILVGATTENPFFEVNKALVSRSRIFQLVPLTKEDLYNVAKMAINDVERGYGNWNVCFEEKALQHLVETANGDARCLLNALELAIQTTPKTWPAQQGEKIFIDINTAEQSIQKKVILYDRDGDYHYDVISAFIKSIRGSDPDAALYWLARMVRAGEDPHFIFRRLLISACEDTGLADPNAITIVESCARSFDRIGFPEGKFHLTHATLYLATTPKSNSTLAFFDAADEVEKEGATVPNHLRDSSRDTEGFGHGKGYLYPHAYRNHWVSQQYLPDALVGKVFYMPSNQGYEQTIAQEILSRRELQVANILNKDKEEFEPFSSNCVTQHHKNNFLTQAENLTFSPQNENLAMWHKRTEENRSEVLLTIRNTLLDFAQISRHATNLVVNADDGLFVWELYRRSPEGFTAGFCRSTEAQKILEKYAQTLPVLEQPALFVPKPAPLFNQLEEFTRIVTGIDNKVYFDTIVYTNPIHNLEDAKILAHEWKTVLKNKSFTSTRIVFSQKIFSETQYLSSIFFDKDDRKKCGKNQHLFDAYKNAEKLFYEMRKQEFNDWNEQDLKNIFEEYSLSVRSMTKNITKTQIITEEKLLEWFNAEKSSYAQFLQKHLSLEEFSFIKKEFLQIAKQISLVNIDVSYYFFILSK